MKDLGSRFYIEEGLRDFEEIRSARRNGWWQRVLRVVAVITKRRGWEDSSQEALDSAYTEAIQRVQAQTLARKIGLRYWPAMIGRPLVDSQAFLIAEEILFRKTGYRWGDRDADDKIQHGGWDSFGCHGISRDFVADAWKASGCKDSPKFRFQVYHGIQAKKGDSFTFFKNFVAGWKWARARGLSGAWIYPGEVTTRLSGRKAFAALGRLPEELRIAAMKGLDRTVGYNEVPTLRIRDLNWGEVRRIEGLLVGGNLKVRAALLGATKGIRLLGGGPSSINQDRETCTAHNNAVLVPLLTPSYSNLPVAMARRVVLGETLVEVSGGLLNKKEAHKWAGMGAPDVTEWLAQQISQKIQTDITHRSVRVLRWLERCWDSGRWAAVEKIRQHPVAGELVSYSALSMLDEIQDEDIEQLGDSVPVVLHRAQERLKEAFLTEQATQHRILAPMPSWGKTLLPGMTLLRTPARLVAEGKTMEHCVGGYADAVERGQCHILSLRTEAGRSTAELSSDGKTVRQHRGVGNSDPVQENEKLLTQWLERDKAPKVAGKEIRNK